MLDNKKVFAVDGGRDPNDVKGLGWDPYMESFILGSGGQITNYDKIIESNTPVLFRGITKNKHMKACEAAGKPAGVLGAGMEMVRGWRAKGFRCLCYGSDVSVFQSALKGALDTLKGEAG